MRIWALVVMAVLAAPRARAEFSGKDRSINGTGETLPAGAVEAGLTSVAYGVSDDWMVRGPSAAVLVGYAQVEVRRRWTLAGAQRVSPYAALETPRHASLGADYGWDLGASREHSVTVGARLRYGPLATAGGDGRPAFRPHTLLLPNGEYDFYTDGNVFYAGIADYLAYVGYTWAFAKWHLGLILGPAAGFIPLPYAALRF